MVKLPEVKMPHLSGGDALVLGVVGLGLFALIRGKGIALYVGSGTVGTASKYTAEGILQSTEMFADGVWAILRTFTKKAGAAGAAI
jgi:hypothetical protein